MEVRKILPTWSNERNFHLREYNVLVGVVVVYPVSTNKACQKNSSTTNNFGVSHWKQQKFLQNNIKEKNNWKKNQEKHLRRRNCFGKDWQRHNDVAEEETEKENQKIVYSRFGQ